MAALNRSLGAEVLFCIPDAYMDDLVPDEAQYYRIALDGGALYS